MQGEIIRCFVIAIYSKTIYFFKIILCGDVENDLFIWFFMRKDKVVYIEIPLPCISGKYLKVIVVSTGPQQRKKSNTNLN